GKETIKVEAWHKLTGPALMKVRPAGIPEKDWKFSGLSQMRFPGRDFKPSQWLDEVKRAVPTDIVSRYSAQLDKHLAVLEPLIPLLSREADKDRSLTQDEILAEVREVLPEDTFEAYKNELLVQTLDME